MSRAEIKRRGQKSELKPADAGDDKGKRGAPKTPEKVTAPVDVSPAVTVTPATPKADDANKPRDLDRAKSDAEMKAHMEADNKKLENAQKAALQVSVETASKDPAIFSPRADDWVDEGDAKNEAKTKALEEQIKQLKEKGRDQDAENLTKRLTVYKKKNEIAKKKRAEQTDKKQALETFELKARLCERKRTLENRIATLTKLGMQLQVETLSFQLQEINNKLKQ